MILAGKPGLTPAFTVSIEPVRRRYRKTARNPAPAHSTMFTTGIQLSRAVTNATRNAIRTAIGLRKFSGKGGGAPAPAEAAGASTNGAAGSTAGM